MSLPDVTEILPHRPPFLFIDRIVELTDSKVIGVRTFRADEPFFAGHFPDHPVVPGVLLLEGLAQTMAYFALYQRKAPKVFLVGIDRARFRAIVEPGKEVTFEISVGEERFGTLTGKGKVRVGTQRIAEAQLMGYAGDAGSRL